MASICTIHVDIDPAAERVVRLKDLFTKFWMRGDQRLQRCTEGCSVNADNLCTACLRAKYWWNPDADVSERGAGTEASSE